VTLSARAADHIAKFIAKRGKGIGIRLGVRTSGCSGMAYKLEFADAANPEDIEFRATASRCWSIPRACPIWPAPSSTTRAKGLNEGFKFNNPNVKDACGCGESFNLMPA
jgi:iron-sulfur cluster assembly protein